VNVGARSEPDPTLPTDRASHMSTSDGQSLLQERSSAGVASLTLHNLSDDRCPTSIRRLPGMRNARFRL